ncbi:thiamine phosphate synthase [Acetobacter fallax]|nr:thiamine phosphate synthase [Acetobacter fallax]
MAAVQNATTDDIAGCEIYLVTPAISDADAFLPCIGQILSAVPVAAVRLRLEAGAPETLIRAIEILRPAIQNQGVALILDGLPELARQTGCDGVHVDGADVAAARRLIGDSLQLGAFCGTSRDLGMQAGESGADYISFGPFHDTCDETDMALLQWWAEVMELPVVAECGSPEQMLENTALLSQLTRTADFLATGMTGQTQDGQPDALAALLRAIRAAS